VPDSKGDGANQPHMIDTLPLLLNAARRRFGEKTALVFEGRRFSFAELDELSSAFAGSLQLHGVAPGDRVVLHYPNRWEWVVAYYAILKTGAVVVPVNALLTHDELAFIVADCRPRLLVVDAAKATAALELGRQFGLAAIVCVGDGAPSQTLAFSDCLREENKASAAPRHPDDLAMIGYTSGTTGRPKGAMLAHRALSLNASLTALMHGRCSSDVVVSALPLPHVYGNVVMNATFLVGGTLVLLPAFNATDALAAIETHAATMFEGVPTMYLYMLADAAVQRGQYQSLRLCTVGGQTMPIDKMRAVETAFGCPLIELWGMTELAGLGATHPHTGPRKLGSIGTALPFLEARICRQGDDDAEVPAGDIGELQVRGPLTMIGYYQNEGATCEALTPEGWLRTGDLAARDAFGHIAIVDRKNDMILSGGYNVYPAEIERVISAHESVAMVAVCGRRHETKGEVAAAYIVLKPGAQPDAAALETHCRTQLAHYKTPRHFFFVPDLPKTSTGKILRRALRDSIAPHN